MRNHSKLVWFLSVFAVFVVFVPSISLAKNDSYSFTKSRSLSVAASLDGVSADDAGIITRSALIVSSNKRIKTEIDLYKKMAIIRLEPTRPLLVMPRPQEITVTLSGLIPDQTYYLYKEKLKNPIEFTPDTNGSFSFPLETPRHRYLTLMTKPSTYHIDSNSATGGDCTDIGTWNSATDTCTLSLTATINQIIEIDDGGITLDGAGRLISHNENIGIRVNEDPGENMENIVIKNVKISGPDVGILVFDLTNVTIENVEVSNTTTGIRLGDNTSIFVQNSTIKNNPTGFTTTNGTNIQAYRNNFKQNTNDLANISGSLILTSGTTTRGNWWEKNVACVQSSSNPSYCVGSYDAGPATDTSPWFCEDAWVTPCAPPAGGGGGTGGGTTTGKVSNVAFIPGMQGSRLYQKRLLTDKKLWEPGIDFATEDLEKLFMDASGNSINPDVYVKEIIDKVPPLSSNIYESFINFLDDLVVDQKMNDWEPLFYDWRLSLKKIVTEPIKINSGSYNMVDKIIQLANDSDTGKVTIVTHSNGGLVGKLLINELKKQGKENLVDKLIMVAPPQLGTPEGMATLLHGMDVGVAKSLAITQRESRLLAKNMPGIYTLLPSPKYFEKVATPVVEFDESLKQVDEGFWKNVAGTNITTSGKMKDFLLGNQPGFYSRTEPDYYDVASPALVNSDILADITDTQNSLDNWVAPVGIEVSQIIGWGLDTIAGVEYVSRPRHLCASVANLVIPTCIFDKYVIDSKPIKVLDGDKTVITASANFMSGEDRFYVDLPVHNNTGIVIAGVKFKSNRTHADIFEVSSVRGMILKILENSTTSLPFHITTTMLVPDPTDKRLRLELHSPGYLDVYDSQGNHTGKAVQEPDPIVFAVDEEIANSSYIELGEGKYISVNADDEYNVKVLAFDNGSFTLVIETVVGNSSIVATKIFPDFVLAKDGRAEVLANDLTGAVGDLKVDADGDGIFEQTMAGMTQAEYDDYISRPVLEFNLTPETFNLDSNGVLTGHIKVISGNKNKITQNTWKLNGTSPTKVNTEDNGWALKFERQSFVNLTIGEAIEMKLTVKLNDNSSIDLSDTIRTIRNKNNDNSITAPNNTPNIPPGNINNKGKKK